MNAAHVLSLPVLMSGRASEALTSLRRHQPHWLIDRLLRGLRSATGAAVVGSAKSTRGRLVSGNPWGPWGPKWRSLTSTVVQVEFVSGAVRAAILDLNILAPPSKRRLRACPGNDIEMPPQERSMCADAAAERFSCDFAGSRCL
jgi:hypothetical protein